MSRKPSKFGDRARDSFCDFGDRYPTTCASPARGRLQIIICFDLCDPYEIYPPTMKRVTSSTSNFSVISPNYRRGLYCLANKKLSLKKCKNQKLYTSPNNLSSIILL